MPEEQQAAIEVPGVNPAEGHPLMGQSRLGKDTGLQTLERLLLLLLCLYIFAAALFLGDLAWCEWTWGDLHCL